MKAFRIVLLTVHVLLSGLSAQQSPSPADQASVKTRPNARTMTLTVPSPRGLIMDRNGEVYANNRTIYYLTLQFPELNNPSDSQILSWAHKRLAAAADILGAPWTIKDEDLLSHYQHRRWLPLQNKKVYEQDDITSITLMDGLAFQPLYVRNYPQQESAAHIIGYVRSTGKLPTGPINYEDPLWELTSGTEGLENIFDHELSGTPGQRHILVDSDGSRLVDEYPVKPEMGNSLVLTLNSQWQNKAERILKKNTKKGALVLIDVLTGEVLTLASYPHYDLNLWIPYIKEDEFATLRDDKARPMFARAFQARYPPASTFKAIVAASAISNNVVQTDTLIDCPVSVEIGGKEYKNHSKYPDGEINARKALARSNNCWFYQVGIQAGSKTFLAAAQELGFGAKSGLPLFNETRGLIPDNRYMVEKYGRPILDGDTANFAIGQGDVEASPLQVAQAMAGLANGYSLPRLQLIKQIQSPNGNVLLANGREQRNSLSFSRTAIDEVAKGMYDVIHATYGTGKNGYLDFTTMTGKTGTAQWVQGKELAWFAGFFPYEKPRFAYAALYEGSTGESVSGGRKAAPIIKEFLSGISSTLLSYMEKTDIYSAQVTLPSQPDLNNTAAAIIIDDEPIGDEPLRALIVDDDTEPNRAVVVDEENSDQPIKAIIIEE